MKNKRIKLIGVIILGLSLTVYVFKFFSNATTELSNNPIKLEQKIPLDYISLFNSQAQGYIVLKSATSFKLRNTIVDVVYKNEYDIMITKISVESGFDLKNDIIGNYNKSENAVPQTYSSYNQNNFRVTYNGSSNCIVSEIYLTLDGDSTANYYKGDSLTYYYSCLKTAKVQYKHKGINEIIIEAKKKFNFIGTKKPIIIMFIKRTDWLYFVILSGRNGDTLINPD